MWVVTQWSHLALGTHPVVLRFTLHAQAADVVDTRTQLAADHPALLVAAPAEEVVLVVRILNTANS